MLQNTCTLCVRARALTWPSLITRCYSGFDAEEQQKKNAVMKVELVDVAWLFGVGFFPQAHLCPAMTSLLLKEQVMLQHSMQAYTHAHVTYSWQYLANRRATQHRMQHAMQHGVQHRPMSPRRCLPSAFLRRAYSRHAHFPVSTEFKESACKHPDKQSSAILSVLMSR